MKIIICAICKKKTKYRILYKSTLNPKFITYKTFMSRRIPDRIHFRIVRCLNCGLTYSNPIYDPDKIVSLYKESCNPTEDDIKSSGKVYASYLKSVLNKLSDKLKILDIGCGDGFFLKEAKRLGFKELYGVEPSKNAVNNLIPELNRKKIIIDIFKRSQFKKDFFDVITFFQVFDHVLNPNKFLQDCHYLLKPGGYVLAIMHDAKSWQARLLGEKSPIFDFQHIYLFDKKNIKKIFENNGFIIDKIVNSINIYSAGYWLKMAPSPIFIKRFVMSHSNWSIFDINIPLRVGNMLIIAKKKNYDF